MGISLLLNGTLGFAMLIALIFCMPGDIQGTLNSDTLYPFMNIYTHAVGSNAGATAMVRLHCLGFILSLSILRRSGEAHVSHPQFSLQHLVWVSGLNLFICWTEN